MSEPISIKGKASQVTIPEGVKVVMLGAFAIIVDRTMHSETAIIAVLAAGGFAVTAAWAIWQRLRSWSALVFLGDTVPDSVAQVKR